MLAVACFSGPEHFAHVFVVVRDGWRWIKLDGSGGRLTVKDMGYEPPAARLRADGWIVVETEISDGRNYYPAMGATCVGMVKRVLGVNAPFVWTSKQLRVFLEGKR